MDMRQKLINLIEDAEVKARGTIGSMNNGFGAWYADYLLAHGAVVLPECTRVEASENCLDCAKLYSCEKAKNVENYKLKSGCSEFEGGQTMTNYDRIRNMSVEEMAEFILQIENGDSDNCLLKKIEGIYIFEETLIEWLKSEVEE